MNLYSDQVEVLVDGATRTTRFPRGDCRPEKGSSSLPPPTPPPREPPGDIGPDVEHKQHERAAIQDENDAYFEDGEFEPAAEGSSSDEDP
jgi:hypothetical protein